MTTILRNEAGSWFGRVGSRWVGYLTEPCANRATAEYEARRLRAARVRHLLLERKLCHHTAGRCDKLVCSREALR